jgi:hypothetical protein
MNPFLGPLDENGGIPAYQQTRVSAFLLSAHGARARQLAAALPARLHDGSQVALHAQVCQELQILSLLTRATSWVPDPMLPFLIWQWEAAWFPKPAGVGSDQLQSLLIDFAAFGHALHGGIRPAALLPEGVAPMDPFVLAMRHIELENGRLMQAQIIFLKGPQLLSVADAVAAALEQRHAQLRELWTSMLHGIDVDTSGRHLVETAYQSAMRANEADQAKEKAAGKGQSDRTGIDAQTAPEPHREVVR